MEIREFFYDLEEYMFSRLNRDIFPLLLQVISKCADGW